MVKYKNEQEELVIPLYLDKIFVIVMLLIYELIYIRPAMFSDKSSAI